MNFKTAVSSLAPPRYSVNRFLHKLGEFLYYDCFEFLIILIGVALILLVWEFSFWH